MESLLEELNRKFVSRTPHMREIGMTVTAIAPARGTMTLPARPDWLGAEATHAQRYYNLALASRPYSQWREDERLALDLKGR